MRAISGLFKLVLVGVLAVAALWVAFQVLGWAFGLVVGTVLFALRLAILAGLVLAAVWGWRRLTRGRRRRGGPPELTSGSLDWQYIRGRIDKETYLHRKAMSRMR